MTKESFAQSVKHITYVPKVTAWGKLQVIMNRCGRIEEGFLNDLPTIESIIEFIDLPCKYDVIALHYIDEAITEDGASPDVWNDFVKKYELNWITY